MSESPNKLIRFWQELKRRKVFKVIAMYAGTAFIILQLFDIIAQPLQLPAWTMTLVIVLLCIGFIITLLIAWIYDITPEGIKKTESIEAVRKRKSQAVPEKRKLKASDIIIAAMAIVIVILAYPKFFSKDKFKDIKNPDGRISIAVMPFENLTGDTTLNWFQRGISSLIINGLGNSSELSVSDDQTMFEVIESINQVISAGISPSLAKEVAEKVVAETYISGSYQGKEGKYWILVNLVNTDNGDIIWTNKVTGDLKSSGYLDLADSLCNEIKNYLEIKALEENADYDFREAYPKSSEAYRYFIEGMNMILTTEWASAIQSLKKALEIDSTFTFASFYLAYAYSYSGEDIQSALWTKKTYGSKNRVPPKYRLLLEQWYAQLISKNLMDINRYGKLLEESGINSRLLWFDIGSTYYYCGAQYKKAVEAYEKVMEISLERGGNWKFESFYWKYGQALHDLGKHEEEKKMYETGLSFFPDSWRIKNNQAVCALSLGDTTKANKYIAKFKSLTLEKGYSENVTEQYLGQVYRDAKIIDKAEVHFRNAYKLDSQNRRCVFWLAWLLIDNDININEGMELSRKALEIWPDAYDLLLVKGWGCYKQGKYKEALDILEKSWDLYPFYSTELAFYIQEAKKAVAGQKNN